MQKAENIQMPLGCDLIHLPRVLDDRGNLVFLESNEHIPFEVQRVFWIYDVPEGKTRGGHAHWTCHEVIFPVTGSFEIEVSDGKTQIELTLDVPNKGVLVSAGLWCCLKNFAPGTVCVVMASQPYLPEGYINNYQDFLKAKL